MTSRSGKARGLQMIEALRAHGAIEPARAREPALEAQIAEEPDDAARYLVYADWLQTRNDARGLLIMLHHAMHAAPGDRAPAVAAQAFLDEHATSLLGRLAPYVREQVITLEWFMGYIKRATIDSVDALRALLACPSAIFLRELVIVTRGAPLPIDPRRIVKLLIDAGQPQTLVHVSIGTPGRWTVPPELRAAFPRLARDPAEVWRDAMARAAEQKKLKIEVDAARLPALVPRTDDISADTRAILAGLKAELDKQRPLGVLAAMPQVFTRESLDAFALALAMEWQQIGESPRWPFDALGPLGGERCVRWIAAHLAGWSHQRAVQAVQHLVQIGSDAAIYEIVTLALAPRHFGARRHDATSALDVVAKMRALRDRDELILRVGPSGGGERVLATQRTWFESLMLAGRRISTEELRRYVAGNPIRRSLASTLLWAEYARDRLVDVFRLDPTGWLVRADGSTYEPRARSAIGLPHPAELTAKQLAGGRSLLPDQAILQLDRPVFALRAADARKTELTRYARRAVGYFALQAVFAERGWIEVIDGGIGIAWIKTFERDGVEVTATLDDRAAAIRSVEVRGRGGFGRARAFASLHPVTVSELLWDLEAAHGTAEPVVAATPARPRPITVERARTGRAKCVVCGESIAKGAQRIGIERRIETAAYTGRATVWLHPACHAGAPELADIDVDALLGAQ